MIMKKILLAAVAALAIVGCTQNEEIENVGNKAEIKVGTLVKTGTRAVVTNNDNFKAFTLKAYTVKVGDIATSGVGTAYMSADYTGGKGKWETNSGTFYWPVKEEMHFFAYPTTEPAMTYTAAATGYPTLSFTVGATAEAQKDLVVAYATVSDKPANNTLSLDFKHILTRINFSYKLEKEGYKCDITGIMINKVSGGTATYTFGASENPWSAGDDTEVNYTYPLGSNAVVDGFYPLDGTDGSLVLLPQDVAGKTITITYSTSDDNHTYFDGTKTVTLPAGAKWGVGQNIRYKLTLPIGAEEVKIETNVEDINETPNSGTAN